MISEGTSATLSFTVDEASTAIALGSGDVPVLGTPKVVALVEEAAVAALAGSLGAGETTVGSNVNVDHLAPSLVGATVKAAAIVTAVEGRKIVFSVRVTE
jgi:predicted thioesterase